MRQWDSETPGDRNRAIVKRRNGTVPLKEKKDHRWTETKAIGARTNQALGHSAVMLARSASSNETIQIRGLPHCGSEEP